MKPPSSTCPGARNGGERGAALCNTGGYKRADGSGCRKDAVLLGEQTCGARWFVNLFFLCCGNYVPGTRPGTAAKPAAFSVVFRYRKGEECCPAVGRLNAGTVDSA